VTLDPRRRAWLLTILGKAEAAADELEEEAKESNFQALALALRVLRSVIRTNRNMVREDLDPTQTPQRPYDAELEEVGVALGSLWGLALEALPARRALVQGLFGKGATVRIPKPPRRFQTGAVSSEQLRGSPGLRLDASYHLDSPEARSKARRQ